MTLPFNFKELKEKFKGLDVGQNFEVTDEDYRGQISRAAYNEGLNQRKIFSTRRFDGFIYVVRLM